MNKDHNKSVTRETEKNDKRKPLIDCARKDCPNKFPQRGKKKYCSAKCQWTDWNEKHPIVREK